MRKLADMGEEPGRPPRPVLAFRRMRMDDLPRVMEIENAAFAHPWSPELLCREMTHDWSTVLLASGSGGAEPGEGEAVLGFIIYWLVHDELHVLNVAVARGDRRQGVGRALMREAHGRARRHGASIATLEVRRSNAPAIELYRSLGYRQVGVRTNYYVDEGEDAIVMVLEL